VAEVDECSAERTGRALVLGKGILQLLVGDVALLEQDLPELLRLALGHRHDPFGLVRFIGSRHGLQSPEGAWTTLGQGPPGPPRSPLPPPPPGGVRAVRRVAGRPRAVAARPVAVAQPTRVAPARPGPALGPVEGSGPGRAWRARPVAPGPARPAGGRARVRPVAARPPGPAWAPTGGLPGGATSVAFRWARGGPPEP